MIHLRSAQMSDGDLLFGWRNDPLTRASFRSTAAVPREDHDRWMKFNVAIGYPQHLVAIAQSQGEDVGVIRFDACHDDLMAYEVSITMAPAHRGKGLSRLILAEASGYMQDYCLRAEVRQENTASRRIFERCGFTQIGTDGGFIKYRKESA